MGRRSEDGPIDMRYPLQECDSEDYRIRTRLNLLDSDATLILSRQTLSGGTLLTEQLAHEHGRQLFVCRPDVAPPDELLASIIETPVRTLNIAGPRDSETGRVYQEAYNFITSLLSRL